MASLALKEWTVMQLEASVGREFQFIAVNYSNVDKAATNFCIYMEFEHSKLVTYCGVLK